ncbi:MAG: type II toxin-antitoxin system HigB family toxin [Gallionella sp.]|nr:type II toxin-antitoxin system HigB family toxin [Gallionella sp.]
MTKYELLEVALREFWLRHPESRPMLNEWFRKASQVTAVSFPALRESFGSADYVDGFTLFDVGGNKYRIAAVIHYDKQRMYIRQVMTHAEYDRNDWRKK